MEQEHSTGSLFPISEDTVNRVVSQLEENSGRVMQEEAEVIAKREEELFMVMQNGMKGLPAMYGSAFLEGSLVMHRMIRMQVLQSRTEIPRLSTGERRDFIISLNDKAQGDETPSVEAYIEKEMERLRELEPRLWEVLHSLGDEWSELRTYFDEGAVTVYRYIQAAENKPVKGFMGIFFPSRQS